MDHTQKQDQSRPDRNPPDGERSFHRGRGRGGDRGRGRGGERGRASSRGRGGRGARENRGDKSGGRRNRELGRAEWRCVRHALPSFLSELISEAVIKLTSEHAMKRISKLLKDES